MRSNHEKKLITLRDSAEALIRGAHGEDVLDIVYSFSDMECFADVQMKDGWIRYLLLEGGEGENDDALRRIG